MPDHPRNKPPKSYTLKPENAEYVVRQCTHRELSRSRMMDEIIEFHRERYDPTYRSHRRLTAPNKYGAGM
jgi:hypothetical protein